MYCPYCGSTNIEPYKVKYYKCLDCLRVFVTPAAFFQAPKKEENEEKPAQAEG